MTTNALTNFNVNDRVVLRGRPGITGTFVRYFKPFNNGSRNVLVEWDDKTLFLPNYHESQVALVGEI